MKRTKKGKRLIAVALSAMLAFGSLPTAALAEGQPGEVAQGLCEHHLGHTAECGYAEGHPCEHEHSEDCYTDEFVCAYVEGAEATASSSDAEHIHTQECYALDCPHERGEHTVNGGTANNGEGLSRDHGCGYVEAQPCGYTCELCGTTDNRPVPEPGKETGQAVCTLAEGCILPNGHEGGCVTGQLPADAALVKTITAWKFVGDDNLNEGVLPLSGVNMERQADFDTVVSMLPTGILAEVAGETGTVQVDLTGWSCPEYEKDADGNWPLTGEYVFTAVLPDGYACDTAPTVKALIGGAAEMDVISGKDYSFNQDTGELIIKNDNGINDWLTDESVGLMEHKRYELVKSVKILADVTKIGSNGFYKLTSVTFAEGSNAVIEKFAFRGSSYLTSVTFANNSKVDIGEYAFSMCSKLESVTIPSGTVAIREGAFESCTGLKSVILADGLKADIGEAAFDSCTVLESITIPSGVTSIGIRAFANCKKLKSITIPSGVTVIEEKMFTGCESLKSVTIPSGVTGIKKEAFNNCTALESITLPETVKDIGKEAFNNCTALKSINIPDGVTSIEEGAFSKCASLKSITIPASVTSIGMLAFSDCGELSRVVFLGVDAPQVGVDVFYSSANIVIHVPDGATSYDNGLIWPQDKIMKDPASPLTALSISDCTLTPAFSIKEENYTAEVPATVESVTVTPSAYGTITVNGSKVTSGTPSEAIALEAGQTNAIEIVVATDETLKRTYTVKVKRAPLIPIDISSISGVQAPVRGGTPVTEITETAQYTGTVSWNPSPINGMFAANKEYTATITLAPKVGYTLLGVEKDFFTVVGASTTMNAADSGKITAVFPRTDKAPIDLNAIEGIVPPVREGTPVASITESEQYTGTVSWNPNHSTFAADTDYTATITLTPKEDYTLLGVRENFFTIAGASTVTNAADSGEITAVFPRTGRVPIDLNAIEGIAAPVRGETPVTEITETEQYTGTVSWSPSHSTFAADTDYTATITLTPKGIYTLQGVKENFFTVAGATTVTNAAENGEITAVFPRTDKVPIDLNAIEGITAPVRGGTPVTEITETEQYTGTVSWSPSHSTFAADTDYKATITLTPKGIYTLQGVKENFFTVVGATTVTNAAGSGEITAVFPKTSKAPIDLKAIEGIVVPVRGETPVTSVAETAQYTGTVSWNPSHSPFAADTDYTATITLVPKAGYTLQGVTENFFTVVGAATVTNAAGSGEITAVFPRTSKAPIDLKAIEGIVVPVRGETPVTSVAETAQYTGTVSWNPSHSPFAADTDYTATITLVPKAGYTLQGVTENFFTVVGATVVTNAADSGEITAVFPRTGNQAYTVRVETGENGTASSSPVNAVEGETITLYATADSGYHFKEWQVVRGGIAIANNQFTMPAEDVTVKAIFEKDRGGSSGGDDGGGSSDNTTATAPRDTYKSASSQAVSRSDLQRLADAGKDLSIQSDTAAMSLSPAALRAILAAVPAAAGNITFTAVPADISAFPEAAKLIGTRPAYSFTISYKDNEGNAVSVKVDFPAGSVSISMNYAPAESEVAGSLFMVYVDGKGAVTWLDKSSYSSGKVMAGVPHFSVYGVAYKAPATVFTDITNHWAKEDMEFVAARGLLSGTGEKVFSPDVAMTRGMFVTALGRLAGVNPDSYKTCSFTDVKADAYYAPYVEWATQKNIIKGTGEGAFSPDVPVTREQMAVMMTNYAGQMGYSIPAPLAAVTFADNDKIGVWAAKDVAAMQRAGIIKGKDGNRFDPQGNATRAEVSAVLRRFVQTVIDPATATGWVRNDSGHWLYYQGGKALIGWQTIGKLRYYFNADGVMHQGWKQDTDTNKWYYWTNAGAVTGWREIDGKWYYFDENGVMAVNIKIDGYEVGLDGARKDQ